MKVRTTMTSKNARRSTGHSFGNFVADSRGSSKLTRRNKIDEFLLLVPSSNLSTTSFTEASELTFGTKKRNSFGRSIDEMLTMSDCVSSREKRRKAVKLFLDSPGTVFSVQPVSTLRSKL